MKKITLVFTLFFIYNGVFAQNNKAQAVNNQLRQEVMTHLKSEKLKDSIALYTFAFQIEVEKTKDSTLVKSITVSDSIANVIFANYDFLRKKNYLHFISKAKRATLVIPFGLIVANYSANKRVDKTIPLTDLAERINKMFNYDQKKDARTEHFIYLSPITIYLDKAVYD